MTTTKSACESLRVHLVWSSLGWKRENPRWWFLSHFNQRRWSGRTQERSFQKNYKYMYSHTHTWPWRWSLGFIPFRLCKIGKVIIIGMYCAVFLKGMFCSVFSFSAERRVNPCCFINRFYYFFLQVYTLTVVEYSGLFIEKEWEVQLKPPPFKYLSPGNAFFFHFRAPVWLYKQKFLFGYNFYMNTFTFFKHCWSTAKAFLYD